MKTILLVDDSTTLLMSIKAILEKAGYAVQTATGGDAALKLLATVKPNLMITDLNMPGMDGITLIKEVKKLPTCRFMPVLVMTQRGQEAADLPVYAGAGNDHRITAAEADRCPCRRSHRLAGQAG